MLAEFVDVVAALIEMPMSHHGIDLPERKKSFASLLARREHASAIPAIKAKKSPIINQSTQFSNMVI